MKKYLIASFLILFFNSFVVNADVLSRDILNIDTLSYDELLEFLLNYDEQEKLLLDNLNSQLLAKKLELDINWNDAKKIAAFFSAFNELILSSAFLLTVEIAKMPFKGWENSYGWAAVDEFSVKNSWFFAKKISSLVIKKSKLQKAKRSRRAAEPLTSLQRIELIDGEYCQKWDISWDEASQSAQKIAEFLDAHSLNNKIQPALVTLELLNSKKWSDQKMAALCSWALSRLYILAFMGEQDFINSYFTNAYIASFTILKKKDFAIEPNELLGIIADLTWNKEEHQNNLFINCLKNILEGMWPTMENIKFKNSRSSI